MNRYYITYIVMLFAMFQLQASQEMMQVSGGIVYIDGPIAYGPAIYYAHLSEKCGIPTDCHEPLINVSVMITDTDKDNVQVPTFWTNNDSLYRLVGEDQLILNEEAYAPRIIRKNEKEFYKKQQGEITQAAKYDIKRTFFPSYIPVRLFKDIVLENVNTLQLSVFSRYVVALNCESKGQSTFKDDLIAQLRTFVGAPRYFKWRTEGTGSTDMYNPIKDLMKKQFIKSKPLPVRRAFWTMCHNSAELCPVYCSADPDTYEHGIKGIEDVVEKLEIQFNLVAWPAMEMGNLGLITQMMKIRDARREGAREENPQ